MASLEVRRTSSSSSKDKEPVSKRESIVPAPPASAFGDDDEDYKRVTKQQKAENSNVRSSTEIDVNNPNFGKATFSKSPKVRPDISNVLPEQGEVEHPKSEENGTSVDHDSSEHSTEHSTEQSTERSDDQSHVTMAGMESDSGNWQKFAQTKFQMKGAHSYLCAALPQPLLPKRDKADHLASLAAWVTILRIMGDLPEVEYGESFAVSGQTPPVVERVKRYFNKKYVKKDVEEAHKNYTDLFKDPSAAEIRGVPFLPDNRESMLEKVQYVCSLGIYKADIRDELYCQVCRQLTNNPSRNSTVRGWVLLHVFAGSFSPSEKFAPTLLQFLKDGPTEYAQRVERVLRKTFVVGTRGQPPSWLEFQAAKNSKPILIPVILMNGQRLLLEADSSTTVSELCSQVSQACGLIDRSGFSIYITLAHRIACLGHGVHRVMDAISECEQNTRDLGMRESSSTWRIYFRKEFFTPWYTPGIDPKGTDLTYQQIMRGVSVGEYKCDKEEVLIMMAAQRYYIEHSAVTDASKIETFLKDWLPKEQKDEKEMSYWVEKVKAAVETDFSKEKPNVQSLKSDIVTFAMNKWYSLFSRFYDASRVQGPTMTWPNVIIGLNCKGINIMDESENVKIRFTFVEITNVLKGRHAITLSTIQGDDYLVSSPHIEDLFTMIMSFQLGLRRRSQYALTIQDASHFESAIGFGLSKGDLVKLDKPYEESGDADVYMGTCVKNNKHGAIPRDVVYILPTIDEPKADVMGMLAVQLRKDLPVMMQGPFAIGEGYTLQGYSKRYFRQASESSVTKLLSKASFKKKEKDVNWKWSKDALKKPLLKKTNLREDMRRTAIRSFLAIQRFMGDAPNKELVSDVEMVNECVIDPALRNRYLRDEVFCQIVKQLTFNPDKSSEERGWQLFWLLSSCTYPQSELLEEIERFLKSTSNVFAKRCLERIHKTKVDGCRLYPPHYLEHEALSQRHTVIEYHVLIPDQTRQKIDIDSSTRMYDVERQIAHKLQLKSSEEYGMFFGLRDRVINVVRGDYFFDYLTHVQRYWAKEKRESTSGTVPAPPMLIFIKKLWMNVVPGVDKPTDIRFHFPQELQNYMRGYHKCTADEAADLSALLFRAKYGDEQQPFDNIVDVLPSLLPQTVLNLRNSEDWKERLHANISKLKFPTKEDGKVAFLKALQKWRTFGAVFFEVKQRSSKSLPNDLMVAINCQGVTLIDTETKSILTTYPFDKVPNWAFDEYSFTLVIGEASGVQKIYMETNVGHNMDDLVMTYVAWLMNSQIKKKPSYAGIVVGESIC